MNRPLSSLVWPLLTLTLVVGAWASESPLVLDERPEPLRAAPRSEDEEDRVEAMALFATGRARQQEGDAAAAIRFYARAHRCDPAARSILQELVPLAYREGRADVALRYALEVDSYNDQDPLLLRRLGLLLTERGDYRRAAAFYEQAKAARGSTKPTAADVLLDLELARLYYLAEDYRRSAECFDHVQHALDHADDYALDDKLRSALLGEPGPTYNLMGDTYLLADRPADAEKAFNRAHELAPNGPILGYHQACVLAALDKPQEALTSLEKYFAGKEASEGTEPYDLLATLLTRLGRKDTLMARLEGLRNYDPRNAPLGYTLAEQYEAAKRPAEAIKVYQYGLEQSPTVEGYKALVRLLVEQRRTDELLDTLGSVVGHTGQLDAVAEPLEPLIGDVKRFDELLAAGRRRLSNKPEPLPLGACRALMLLAIDAKRWDAAGEFFQAAMERGDAGHAEVLLDWGIAMLLAEKYDEAIAVFQRGLDKSERTADPAVFHYYLATALIEAGRTDEAIDAAQKAARARRGSARFQSRIGWVDFRAKRYEEAAGAYERVIERFDANYGDSDNREVLRDTRLSLSSVHVLRGEIAQAEERLVEVLDEFPDDVGALNDLGYLWADQGKHLGRALRMIERAVEADSENAAYRDSLGWVYFRLGRFDEAVDSLRKAVAARPEGVVLEHLGDALRSAGQTAAAKETYGRAAAAYRKENEPAKATAVEAKAAGS